jgi:hypothetical protein
MKILTGKFLGWLAAQTRLVRYFVIAVLFHVAVLAMLGTIKIVAVLPRIMAAFEAPPLPPPPEEEPDPFAAYRDFEYTGPTLGGGGGTPGKGPGGVPTAGGLPEHYKAAIETPAAQPAPASVAEVIGVFSDAATAIARPVGGPTPLGLTAIGGMGESRIGTPGIRGPGGGIFGARMGPQRAVALQKYRGSAETEKAVLAALRWLKANQRPDGSWPCEQSDLAGTALAVLAFLGHGETPDTSAEFGETVHKGLQFLVSRLDAHGLVMGVAGNPHGYTQGLVTLALSEGYAMTGSPALRQPLERAVQAVVRWQQAPKNNPKFHGGWRYTPVSPDADVSVSGWMIMALKSAAQTGIAVPQHSFDQAAEYLWRMYGGPGFGYENPGTDFGPTAIAALCMQFLGHGKDKRVTAALDWIRQQKVDWKRSEGSWLLYSWYYATQAMFQAGGSYWVHWNREFRDETVKNQLPDGRWPLPEKSEWEQKTVSRSPVYSTSLAALSLEVYYRYLPIYQLMQEQAAEAQPPGQLPSVPQPAPR